MISVELIEFCEDNSISIKKFLKENFTYSEEQSSKEKRKKKNKIKNEMLESFPLIVPVSIKFAFRYSELVLSGKLVIVVDDFGKYQTYINPRILMRIQKLSELYEKLEQTNTPFNDLSSLRKRIIEKNLIRQEIEDLEEDLRIIKHFQGIDSLEEAEKLSLGFERIVLQRKNLNKTSRSGNI